MLDSKTPLFLPAMGLGTWGMGGRFERDVSTWKSSIKTLHEALKIGYRLFDVAEIYGAGLTEEIVGEALKNFPRDQVCLVSKVWKTNLYPQDIRVAIEGSLKRLRTDHVDLYLVHWPNPDVPLEVTMPAMEKLVIEGKVRAIGVSNFSVSEMQEASRYLRSTKLFVNQIEYNLLAKSAEIGVIPYCKKNEITVMSYRPLAKGRIASTHQAVLEELAIAYQKTPTQVALNWLIYQGTIPIPKATTREHLAENLGALGWSLSVYDVEKLNSLYK